MTTASSQFFAILTAVGEAKQANANALGVPWTFSQLGVGDANLTDPVPSREQTRLINERRRAPLNQLKIDPANASIIIAEQVIPPDVGGWWIREIGLYDADGDLVAVANCAPSFKPLLTQGTGKTQVVRLNIIVTSTANVQLKIDPAVVLATRSYVDAAILEVLPKNKTPGEYTRVKINDRGLVLSGDNPTTLAANGITDAYTKEQVDAIIAQASALPVGAMVAFPVDKVAPGFLEVDGSVKSIAVYPDLAAFLGTTFNKGDEGAGNFRLPESRAEFLRGWDHGRGVDAGRGIGTWQKGSLQSFDPSTASPAITGLWHSGADVNVAAIHGLDSMVVADYPVSQSVGIASGVTNPPGAGVGVTRPRNLAVIWCIKAWNAPINQGHIDIAALEREVQQIALNGPVVGGARNVRMSITVTSVSATLTAEEVIVETALRGRAYKLGAFNKQINLASVGAGGMDAGAAPANGFVAIYAIYNPTTAMSDLLAVNATSVVAPEVYGGANMPAGYEASALVSVWPTINGLLTIGLQLGRSVSINRRSVLATTTQQGSLTPLSLEATVPKNANEVSGDVQIGSSVSASLTSGISGSATSIGSIFQLSTSTAAQGPYRVSLATPQTIYYLLTAAAGAMNAQVYVSGYAF
jgi:hypothetical protein